MGATAYSLSLIAGLHVALLVWAFRNLPKERWMMMAAIPVRPDGAGGWTCVNMTYYGFFSALGMVCAVSAVVFMVGAAGQAMGPVLVSLVILFALCIPASRVINRLVEGHSHGFTIGGASFVGMVASPWVLVGTLKLWYPGEPVWDRAALMLGAMATGYALGEGIGRLACLSFGCCYGKRVEDCGPVTRRFFGKWAFVYEGPLKKAETEHGWGGQRLVPVQGVTAILCGAAGWAGLALFLKGHPLWAYVIPLVVTQVWRFGSEFLRADYRGGGTISAYQWMALTAALYGIALSLFWPDFPVPAMQSGAGAQFLLAPLSLLLIVVFGSIVFIRMGVSTVTDSVVHFRRR
jgi:hypothetical protein